MLGHRKRCALMTEWDWGSAKESCRMKVQGRRKSGGCQPLDGRCQTLSLLIPFQRTSLRRTSGRSTGKSPRGGTEEMTGERKSRATVLLKPLTPSLFAVWIGSTVVDYLCWKGSSINMINMRPKELISRSHSLSSGRNESGELGWGRNDTHFNNKSLFFLCMIHVKLWIMDI